jgi:hypothetical protein
VSEKKKTLMKIFGPKRVKERGYWGGCTSLANNYKCNKTNNNETGWTCGTYEEKDRCTKGFR